MLEDKTDCQRKMQMYFGVHRSGGLMKDEFIVLKAELYDEDGYLVRTEAGIRTENP